jgi:guanosine-3',5'-bis(diphosphate) 3'-pyrophosphohydrolase
MAEETSINDVIESAKKYLPSLDEARIVRAFEFAQKAHSGQMRKDGMTPYIMHPLETAYILTDYRVDEDTLISALLHDVPEDTDYSIGDVERAFGKTVAFLVEGITKLAKVHYRHDMLERQIESLKKLFIHTASDPRIILMKLADRLHNMRTIQAIQSPEKQTRIARETLEIYIPIANLIGVWNIKHQLEDLCFKTLSPNEFQMVDNLVQSYAPKQSDLIKKTIKEVKRILDQNNIPSLDIQGRYKTHYSIYRKMLLSDKSFNQIFDIVGIRIILEDVGLCYRALGVLHQQFTPKAGRLKDFIALPKSNGYKSIHTTVFGFEGAVTEFQIRTKDMHFESEYGIAAHYFYREAQDSKRKEIKRHLQKKYDWVQKILDLQRASSDNSKFMRHLKLDIFSDRIFVFTPKGDVIDLPQGSTVIDFAYHIHSDVGMLAIGAKINGHEVSLTRKLRSNDVVEVMTSEESEGPQLEWLNIVQTNLARARIKEFLKERDRTTLLQEAENLLDAELKSIGVNGVDAITQIQRLALTEHFGKETWEDLLQDVGEGNLRSHEVINILFSEEDLLGEIMDPVSLAAYKRSKRAGIKEFSPKKVHQIHMLVEAEERVGALGEICSEIANLGINIIEANFSTETGTPLTKLHFLLEIEDFEQYERAVYAIKKIHGVINVTKTHNGKSTEPNSTDSHKKHVQ